MELNQKTFRLLIIVLASGALLCLAGAVIGRSALGWILFASGLILIAAMLIWRFSQLKELFTARRFWVLIGAGALAVLLLTALVIMLLSGTGTNTASSANNNLAPVSGTPPAGAMPMPVENATATETTTTTVTATVAATSTPEPTIKATAVAEIFVCLNEKTRVGYNLRVAPADDAAFGGLLDWGACFTVDGRAAGTSGWYHIARGQDGQVGVAVDVDESVYQLWVKGYYLESFGNDLESLPEIEVTGN
jgi:hypothetical protein